MVKSSTKEGAVNFFSWLVINGVFPVLLPLFIAVLCSYVYIGKAELENLSLILFDRGIYLFLGITILLSLYQDYPETKSVFSLAIHGFFGLILVITSFLFTTSMEFISIERTLSDNKVLHFGVLMVSLAFSIYVKIKIIRYKIKLSRHGI